MFTTALLAALAIMLCSLAGVFFFGNTRTNTSLERFVVPVAVGVFLALILIELLPETLAADPTMGAFAIAVGFIGFYILSHLLHEYFHKTHAEHCDRKSAAALLLTGDAIHHVADGVILGAAFMVDPVVGIATAIGITLHEVPQEIVEFGVLTRAGYTRLEAAIRNLISASTVVLGVVAVYALAAYVPEYLFILTGIAAGNLLYIAASDLLPDVHVAARKYGSFTRATSAIILGFVLMAGILVYAHEEFGHGHAHSTEEHAHDHSHDHAEMSNEHEHSHEEEHEDEYGHDHHEEAIHLEK